jgi:hypothetical protein
VIRTIMPHSDFGDRDCDGNLKGVIGGKQAHVVCTECNAVVRTVPAAELQRTLDEMECSLGTCAEMCPHCRKVNLFPGFSRMLAFTCKECGKAVDVTGTSEKPD